jgi:hypothetical protein
MFGHLKRNAAMKAAIHASLQPAIALTAHVNPISNWQDVGTLKFSETGYRFRQVERGRSRWFIGF